MASSGTTKTANGKRVKKSRPSGTRVLVGNKMKEPGLRMVEWRARSGERWAIARARMQEKFAHWGASMKLGIYTATHPVHPMRREAAKQAMKHKKVAATEKRMAREAAAHSMAAAKRARAREARVNELNKAVR
ncbi:hypothetical protein R1sor_000154 [Riccia sorocarpa]|uniref:Uncharacterized protein n=1 Tax=Riccia sorocarpa TaxID=122646 RepID=A0ABD3GVC8_9MARC